MSDGPVRDDQGGDGAAVTSAVTLLTIVAESLLEDRLVRDLVACGATGWTITACRGHGASGSHAGEFEGGNIRVEALLPTAAADRAWAVLRRDYLDRYSVTVWQHPVQVQRAARFG